MRLYELLHQVAAKFAPMDDKSRTELLGEAITEYQSFIDTARIKVRDNEVIKRWNFDHQHDEGFVPKLLIKEELKDKIAALIEKWYMRYVFALLFVWIVPVLHRYMLGGEDDEETNDEDDFMEYLRFKRMKSKL